MHGSAQIADLRPTSPSTHAYDAALHYTVGPSNRQAWPRCHVQTLASALRHRRRVDACPALAGDAARRRKAEVVWYTVRDIPTFQGI